MFDELKILISFVWKRKRKSMIIIMVVLVGLTMVIGGFLSSNYEEINNESTIIVEGKSDDGESYSLKSTRHIVITIAGYLSCLEYSSDLSIHLN